MRTPRDPWPNDDKGDMNWNMGRYGRDTTSGVFSSNKEDVIYEMCAWRRSSWERDETIESIQ